MTKESLDNKVNQLITNGDVEGAISLLRTLSDQGDSYAMYYLGRSYGEGKGNGQDGKKALFWYKKAWEASDNLEMKGKIAADIGSIYFQGTRYVDADSKAAVRWFQKSAEEGSDWGYSGWGSCFTWGIGERKNAEKAIELYKKAYDQHGEVAGVSANNIGLIYQGNTGEEPDYKKAAEWFQKAADEGFSWGIYNLASLCEEGRGIRRNTKKAMRLYRQVMESYEDDAAARAANQLGMLLCQWFRPDADAYSCFCRAASLGSALGMYNAGLFMQKGIQGKPDLKRAVRWFSQAYNQGESEVAGVAANRLGLIYGDETFIWSSQEKACRWFRKSAKQGYGWGAYNLADHYMLGNGVHRNPKKAIQFYTIAYEYGEDVAGDAANRLGMVYEMGAPDVPSDLEKACDWYQESAHCGCPSGIYSFASMYDEGKGCHQDQKMAVGLYQLAYRTDDEISPYAAHRIGEIYQEGTGLKRDLKKAFMWFEKASDYNLGESFFALGLCYEDGEGTEMNPEQALICYRKAYDCGGDDAGAAACRIAMLLNQYRKPSKKLDKEVIEWLRKSADEGFEWGIFNLADSYMQGAGVHKDGKKAAALLTRVYLMGGEAAGEAANALTSLYASGSVGLRQDPVKCMEWARKSAELDEEYGYYTLGIGYLHGIGVPMDGKKALENLSKAWNKKGETEAECAVSIALLYMHGAEGVPPDMDKARQWFARGAEAGSIESCLFIGTFYQNGLGVEPDGQKAISYFTAACQSGTPAAEVAYMNIGTIYEEGMEGVEKDEKMAVQWFRKGAEQGQAMCAVHIGDCYQNGYNGLEINLKTAMEWYEKASRMGGLGAGVALARMGEIYDYVGGSQYHNMKKAMRCYKKAAKAHCTSGAFHMGECYEMGRGVTANGAKAVEWYSQAASMSGEKSIEAIENLVHIYRHGAVGVEPDETQAAYWENILRDDSIHVPIESIENMIKENLKIQ